MADIITTRVFTDGEKGITATKLNDIIASSVIQPAFVSSKPVASTTGAGDNLLLLKSGGTYAQIDSSVFATALVPLLPAPEPKIWSVRLRSFNAIGNPTFEVAQRNVRGTLVNPANGTLLEDRWACGNVGALNPSFGCPQTTLTAGSGVVVPGTSQVITTAYLRITVGTQKVSLAAGDLNYIQQSVEGPMFRELMSDVHSVSLLVRSSIANLKFCVALGDPTHSRSLTKLCTLGAANTITLIQLPNLPIWPSAGIFTAAPGLVGYTLSICTAAGSTFTSPVNDTWQNGNFIGAVGQDNFMANVVGSTFEVFFVQHEPGPQCSTLMDKPFVHNYDECLRYFCKSYDYATAIATATYNGTISCYNRNATTGVNMGHRFKKPMAKIPGINLYNPSSGALNSVQDAISSAHAVSSVNNTSTESPFYWFGSSALPTPDVSLAHYTADTGW